LPDGIPIHGATGIQYQLPRLVPTISSTPVATNIPAKSAQRGESRTNHANSGSHSAPCTSKRPLIAGSTVRPAVAQIVAPASAT
jgi:hypothetical protein